MHIHRLTDNDKVVSTKKFNFEVTKFEKYRIHVFQNVHNTVSNNRIPPLSVPKGLAPSVSFGPPSP